jgi:hypothetical protein
VELRGLEPLTPCMPCRCATSCATAPDFAALAVSRRSNLISLMHFCPVRQSAAMGVSPATVPCLTAWDGTVAGKLEEPKNPPESSDSGGLSVELRGLEPLTPLHAMQVRYQLRHSPELLLLCELFLPGFPEATQIS